MCLSPKVPKDNSAEIARQQEEQRQARISQGQQSIDQAFTPFNDAYYTGIGQKYLDFYNPQVDKQYDKAKENLSYRLARQGITESQESARQFGDLKENYDTQRSDIANKALQAQNETRGQVEQQKSSLYDLNSSAADPSLIATRAATAASGLQAPAVLSPLGDVFAAFLNTGANAVQAQQAGYPGWKLNLPNANYGYDKSSGYTYNKG